MPVLVSISDAHKAYAGRVLFDRAELRITDRMKVAVIGRNGAGKSTLCRILLGEEQLDTGNVDIIGRERIAYLQQHDPFAAGETVLAFLMRDSGQPDWRCGQVAGRFDLKDELLETPVRELSGGWQTRVKLSAMLLREPELLILDEPTNFLDLRTQLLLERFLADWKGASLVVSHDRAFLERSCDHVCEVARGGFTLAAGTVDDYLAARAEELERLRRENANLESKRRQLQQFVDSNRANANTASQARNKAKQIERLDEQFHAIDDDVGAAVRIHVPEVPARDGTCLRCSGLAIGYGEHVVARDIELEIDRGSKVAVVGDNGQGKTTFVRTIAGSLPALAGEARWTHGAELGVYGQHVFGALPEASTVLEYLTAQAPAGTPAQEILRMAGSFLFRGDDVHKTVAVLSGGERARLILGGMLLHRHTVLVFDEPTNHLDVDTVAALSDALRRYRGTVIVVSHDRSFLGDLADHVIEVGDGTARSFPGDFATYLYRIEQEMAAHDAAPEASPTTRRSDGRRRHELGKQVASLERRIAKLEAQRDELDAELVAATEPARAQRLADRRAAVMGDLAELEDEWAAAAEALEALGPG